MNKFLIGFTFGLVATACAMSKRIDYDTFPRRAVDNSAFMKCLDGDKENVCKYICLEYKKDNTCKKKSEVVEKTNIEESLARGWVMVSRQSFIQLLRGVLN